MQHDIVPVSLIESLAKLRYDTGLFLFHVLHMVGHLHVVWRIRNWSHAQCGALPLCATLRP